MIRGNLADTSFFTQFNSTSSDRVMKLDVELVWRIELSASYLTDNGIDSRNHPIIKAKGL